jgi:hypothetical protein
MKLPRRNFLHLAAGAAALPAGSQIACAQAYPTRPVRIIALTGPGGALRADRPMLRWHQPHRRAAKGMGILKVAKSLGIGTGAVQRISKERAMSPRGAQGGPRGRGQV